MSFDRFAVLGAGAWGSALANVAARAGRQVTLWTRDPKAAAALADKREGLRLPGMKLAGCGGLVTSSSGQRARGAVSSGSTRPSASRSAPAQAIIAPLSVQSAGGGATSTVPDSNPTRCSTLRIA